MLTPHSVLDGDEWSAFRSVSFIPWESSADNDWIRGWLGSRGWLDIFERRIFFFSAGYRSTILLSHKREEVVLYLIFDIIHTVVLI